MPGSMFETAAEHLRVLGSDPAHPTGIVNIYAPVSGVITDQQITDLRFGSSIRIAKSSDYLQSLAGLDYL